MIGTVFKALRLIAFAGLATTLGCASHANQGTIFDRMEKFDRMEQRDQVEIDALLEQAKKCSDTGDFDCARSALRRAKTVALTGEQKNRVSAGESYLQSAINTKQRLKQEEEDRQAMLEQQRRRDEDARARRLALERKVAREKEDRDRLEREELRQKELDALRQKQQREQLANSQLLEQQRKAREREALRLQEELARKQQSQTPQSRGTVATNDADERRRRQEREQAEARLLETERAQRLQEERAEQQRVQRELAEQARREREEQAQARQRERDERIRLDNQEREIKETAKRQEREAALRELRASARLAARTCPGNDIRIVGTLSQSLKSKLGGCVDISYLAQCSNEGGSSGIRGTLRGFVGAASDCYMGDAVPLPSTPACKAENLRITVTDLRTCS